MSVRRIYFGIVLMIVALVASAEARTHRTVHRVTHKKSATARTSKTKARATATTVTVTRTRLRGRRTRRARVRRLVWNPMFRGSHELLVRENEQIDALELARIQDDDELELREANYELVPVEDTRYLTVASNLQPNRRYCKPWTRDFLEDLSEAYYEEFHQSLMITSLVRTAEQQKKLRRHNRNAAPDEGETVSTHLTGMTFDLLKRGMTRRQMNWMNQYFLPLKQLGLIEPIEERRQPVFHVTVFDAYSDWRDSQTVPDSTTTATSASSSEPAETTVTPTTTRSVVRGVSN